MSQGRTPLWESSTILRRIGSGSGRPLTKIPPSWLTPPWPFVPFPMSELASMVSVDDSILLISDRVGLPI